MSNLNDGVGKKIVEALKKQSEVDSGIVQSKNDLETEPLNVDVEALNTIANNGLLTDDSAVESDSNNLGLTDLLADNFVEVEESQNYDFMTEEEKPAPNSDMPGNILVLKKLISQLPSGVTRHTGAQIIRQTMEALGISMKSVLTEAQEVQNNLKESTKECQMTIQEYKRKITNLEKQTQNYQKQYSALNDLISLFIQTTKG